MKFIYILGPPKNYMHNYDFLPRFFVTLYNFFPLQIIDVLQNTRPAQKKRFHHFLIFKYWCRNVRQTVLFEQSIKTALNQGNSSPDLVIEVGPSKALVGAVVEIVQSMGLNPPLVVPTLKRDSECVQVMCELLAHLFEQGVVGIDFKAWFHDLGMDKLIDLPPHPFIARRVRDTVPIFGEQQWWGRYPNGPVAGVQLGGSAGAHFVELSDRTCKVMLDHKMGGQEIIPGMFFVEMVLEVSKLPCTLTNLELKSMCRIPHASAGEVPSLISLELAEATPGSETTRGEARSFVVSSVPTRVKQGELQNLSPTVHCTGYVFQHRLPDSKNRLANERIRPGAFGLLESLELKDIGLAGNNIYS